MMIGHRYNRSSSRRRWHGCTGRAHRGSPAPWSARRTGRAGSRPLAGSRSSSRPRRPAGSADRSPGSTEMRRRRVDWAEYEMRTGRLRTARRRWRRGRSRRESAPRSPHDVVPGGRCRTCARRQFTPFSCPVHRERPCLPRAPAELTLGHRRAVAEPDEMLDVQSGIDENAGRLRLHRGIEFRRRRHFRNRHIVGPDHHADLT